MPSGGPGRVDGPGRVIRFRADSDRAARSVAPIMDRDNETWLAHLGGNAAEALRHLIEDRPFGRVVLVG
jgi:hypothetical protein